MTWTPPLVLVAITTPESTDQVASTLRECGLAVYAVPPDVPLDQFIANTLSYAGATAVDLLVVDVARLSTDVQGPLRLPLMVIDDAAGLAEVCSEVLVALGMTPVDMAGPRIGQPAM